MRERGILMSAPMVRALLAGAKTQTRRAIKLREFGPSTTRGYDCHFRDRRALWNDVSSALLAEKFCPHGPVGRRLWVRETHAQFHVGEGLDRDVPQCVAYRATCDEDGGFDYVNGRGEIMSLKVTKWTPAIHMPRWASRITLEVTAVRVQRLQDISEDDAKAEGVEPDADCIANRCRRPYFDRYMDLWNEINGDGSWQTNPWVWAISFKVVS